MTGLRVCCNHMDVGLDQHGFRHLVGFWGAPVTYDASRFCLYRLTVAQLYRYPVHVCG